MESYTVPDANRLVFTASIMESLITKDHIFLDNFLLSKKFDSISLDELRNFINEYKENYGSHRGFRTYFENYFLEKDLRYLRHSIKKKKAGVFKKMTDNKELSDFFYDLRSQVVHSADLLMISSEIIGPHVFRLRSKEYELNVRIYDYLLAFEKSLVKFFDSDQIIK
jgi:hypothetical protein